MKKRHFDRSNPILDYISEILVHCPRCDHLAQIIPIEALAESVFSPRRVSCFHCGFSKDWREGEITMNDSDHAVDCYFGFSLWLKTDCCGHILWAYNRSHLLEIKNYVQASQRERKTDPFLGWSNSSLISRLPRWIKAAKNRDEIIKSISVLEQREIRSQ
jgi:hypothetical protein